MKKIIKIMPAPLFDSVRGQAYFRDMSKKGYHVHSFFLPFVIFEKGEPLDIEYNIMQLARLGRNWVKDRPSTSEILAYYTTGWELVTYTGAMYIFKSIAIVTNKELSYNLEYTNLNLVPWWHDRAARLRVLLPFCMAPMCCAALAEEGAYSLVNNEITLLIAGLWIMSIIAALRQAIYIAKIRRDVKQDNAERAEWKNFSKKRRLVTSMMVLLVLVIISIEIIPPMIIDEEYSLRKDLPGFQADILRLYDIEGIEKEEIVFAPSGDYNEINVTGNVFTNANYELKEEYILGAEKEKVYLILEYYDVKYPSLVFPIIKGMREDYGYSGHTFVSIENDYFDYTYVMYGYYLEVIFSKGTEIILLRYSGEKTPEQILAVAEQIYGK